MYFCLGCSIIHPKVKEWRGHIVERLDSANTGIINHGTATGTAVLFEQFEDSFLSALDNLISPILQTFEIDPINSVDFRGGSILLVAVTAYYIFVKVTFGRIATIVNIVVAIVCYRWAHKKRKRKTKVYTLFWFRWLQYAFNRLSRYGCLTFCE